MAIANLQNAKLSYDITGHGPPLVLILPQSSGPVGRQAMIHALAQHHAVITYDQRGTGRSSPAPDAMSIAMHGEDVVALLDALGFDQASLLCHSTGCGIGLSVAARVPTRVNTLVLTAPWTHADPHLSTMQNLRIAAARALDPEQYARFNAALLFPPAYRRAHEAGFNRLAVEALSQPHDATVIARRLNAILDFDARPLFPAIQSETLVIVAQDDQLMPGWFADEIGSAMARAEVVEFDGGGHMLPETRTTEFVATVQAFLERHQG